VLALPLAALVWVAPDTRAGQLAAVVLIAGSAITLGRLLAGVTPLRCCAPASSRWRSSTRGWCSPAASGAERGPRRRGSRARAAPAPVGLLRHVGLGYGDFFAAAVVGGILAAERGPRVAAALGMVAVSLCWDQLFLVYDLLPATIPPAVVLIAVSLRGRRGLSLSRPTRAPSRA
jgi:hypothetical protein